jgi:hypothetical protein
MWWPRCYQNTPGKVSDTQYWCETGDSGGVHFNSGIPNHAFALLTDGGTYNGQTIAALGLTKTTNLFWRAGRIYQVPSTDFVDHADALETSCTDLIGLTLYEPKTDDTTPSTSAEVFDATDCAQVTKAIAAVELRTEPTQCNFTPLLDPDEPALCGDGESVATILLTDWESGLGDWTPGTRDVANPLTFDTPDWAAVGALPDDRPGQAAFVIDNPALGDCLTDDESGVLYLESPAISIPVGTDVPKVAFDHWVATEKSWDGGNLKIRIIGSEGITCEDDLTLANDTVTGTHVFNATISITAGSNLIINGSDIDFVAGERIIFEDGVAIGGTFSAQINPDPCWTLIPSSAFTFNEYPAGLASINQGNTNPMAGERAFTGSDGGSVTGTWSQSQISLDGIAGAEESIQLRLDMGLDGCNGLVGWYVDDFRVYGCSHP